MSLLQSRKCDAFEKLANDSSYAWFGISNGVSTSCKRNWDCSVKNAPFTTGILGIGGGWMFKKRSPFLPILNHYFLLMEESGTVWRLRRRMHRPEYDLNYYLPKQKCEHYEGKPIGIHKASSVFGILIIGIATCFIFFV